MTEPTAAAGAFQPIVTQGAARQIADRIRDEILSGRLKSGDRLPTEENLSEAFAVSRPTIREALKILAAQHLVRSRRGPTGGAFISAPQISELQASLATMSKVMLMLGGFDLESILEARERMERVCVSLAAERRSEADLETLRREIEIQRSEQLSDEAFCASDVRFHQAIAAATGNPVLQFSLAPSLEGLQPVENLVVYRHRDRLRVADQHDRLLARIEARDGDGAQEIVSEQIAYLRERLHAALTAKRRRSRKS